MPTLDFQCGAGVARKARRGAKVTLLGRARGCEQIADVVGTAKVGRRGRFTVSAPAFTEVDQATYRARIELPRGHRTFTLPRVVPLR